MMFFDETKDSMMDVQLARNIQEIVFLGTKAAKRIINLNLSQESSYERGVIDTIQWMLGKDERVEIEIGV